MKKYLSILAIILMCAFLFVSCDDFDLGALGGILGDLTGELLSGDEETPDYSNPGGATAAELEGTWTGSSTSFDADFNLIDSVVTVTIGGGNFTISEKDVKGNDVVPFKDGGLVAVADGLITMSLPTTTDTEHIGYIAIREATDVTNGKRTILDTSAVEYLDDPESKYMELVVEGSDLVRSYDFNFGGLSVFTNKYSEEVLSGTMGSEFSLTQENSDLTEDGKITLQIRENTIEAEVIEDLVEKDGEVVRLKYRETDRSNDKISYWFRYNKDTGILELYYGGEPLKLTRKK